MNDLFVCTRCQHVDLTDLVKGEVRAMNAQRAEVDAEVNSGWTGNHGTPLDRKITFEPLVCTKCLTGQWHGQFPYKRYEPATDLGKVVNPPLL